MPVGEVSQQGSPPLPAELLDKSGFLMVRLGMAFKTRAVQELEAAGLNQHNYSVLALLGEQPRKAQATIAEALGVDPSQLVGILDALEQRGLITRQRDVTDRRRHVVSLTPEGERQLISLRVTIEKLEDELFAPLDAESRKTFHAMLLRLAGYHDPQCQETSR
ncbi:MAG TPA: MarR family transcriptional regulator [Jatrophihabitans sp.]|nr:MarR family transcriptional regulator [Jatrophihabitans sp.]